MNRKEFLQNLGLSAGALLATYCLGGLSACSSEGVQPTGSVDFIIDLNDAAYAALNDVGGFIKKDGVVIAQTSADVFVAVTQICSHEGLKRIEYRKSKNDFYCGAHGASFSTSGSGNNSAAKAGLKVYNIDISGSQLHVYS